MHRAYGATVLLRLLVVAAAGESSLVAPWHGATVQDLHREYGEIFKFGNRNAASHLWSTFLLDRSEQMTADRLELMFSGFCAVSGSPVRPNDYNRYKLTLPLVSGAGLRTGALHYCCWPCVCDTQDFIRVDTKTIQTKEGARAYHFAVLGNPCDNEAALHVPFVQPFGRRETTLASEAAEVRCVDGELQGATLSDNGYVIISMFFDLGVEDTVAVADGSAALAAPSGGDQQPGRVFVVGGTSVQDEKEYADMCRDRAANGYNSGMGEIFRKVAAISPVRIGAAGDIGSGNVSDEL